MSTTFTGVASKYLQYHFDGEGKQKWMKMKKKKKRKNREKRKRKIHPSGLGFSLSSLECRESPFSGCLEKYLQPSVLQVNMEGTTANNIGVVEHPYLGDLLHLL